MWNVAKEMTLRATPEISPHKTQTRWVQIWGDYSMITVQDVIVWNYLWLTFGKKKQKKRIQHIQRKQIN